MSSHARRRAGGLLTALVLVLTSLTMASPPPAAATDAWTHRVTTNNSPVTDSMGRVWESGVNRFGTDRRSWILFNKDVLGTTEDDLYEVNAVGAKGLTAPVPSQGVYRVRLLFAEDWYSEAGRRVFDVVGEGKVMEKGVDIAARAGKGRAYDLTFDVEVTDGALDLGFVARVENTLVSAVEITRVGDIPAPPPPPAPVERPVVRMSSWDHPVKDSSGTEWTTPRGWTGNVRRSTTLGSVPIDKTDDDILYQSAVYGMSGWSTPVPEPGDYRVRLHLVDGWWTEPGRRVFDVGAEGKTVAKGIDIFAEVGRRTALVREFTVHVDDGRLDLTFTALADNAIVSAVAVDQLVPAPPSTPGPTPTTPDPGGTPVEKRIFESRMVARPTPVTDSAGHVWSRWSATLGSWRTSTKMAGWDIKGTDEDELYRANVWDVRGYELPVPAKATYRVRLLMAEDSYWSPGHRIFDVLAEGQIRAADVDITAAVGPATAHDLVFDVPVADGRLDLRFVAKKDLPLISAIEVVSTSEVPIPADAPHREVTLAPNSFYTQDISKAPVREDSKAMADALAGEVSSRYGGIAAFNAYSYHVGHHRVPAGTKRVDVRYSCSPDGRIPPSLYDGPGYFREVPVPDDAEAAAGDDGQMTIYDPTSDELWEFWQMRRDPDGGWSACWGGRIDDVSTSQGIFPLGFGASASGLAVTPGMVSLADVRRGRIDHALSISLPEVRSGAFSWPANRTDGTSSSPLAPVEGQRFRLNPALDLDRYNLTPLGRMIAEAAQTYGFVVTDRGGSVAVAAESGALERQATGSDPWDSLIGGHAWDVMHEFPWNEVQFLPMDHGRP